MNIKISVSGMPDILSDAERKITAAVERGAQTVCAAAKEMCPVDTGTLKNSISAEADKMSASVSANTDYAAYVEFGTSRAAAQPYLVPALLQNTDAVMAEIAAALSE